MGDSLTTIVEVGKHIVATKVVIIFLTALCIKWENIEVLQAKTNTVCRNICLFGVVAYACFQFYVFANFEVGIVAEVILSLSIESFGNQWAVAGISQWGDGLDILRSSLNTQILVRAPCSAINSIHLVCVQGVYAICIGAIFPVKGFIIHDALIGICRKAHYSPERGCPCGMIGVVVVCHQHHACPLRTTGSRVLLALIIHGCCSVVGNGGFARLGPLGGHENHAACGTCTIDRGCCVLQHGDTFDVIRVQLVELPCVGIHTVNKNERVGWVGRDAATDTDLGIICGARWTACYGQAWNSSLQGCSYVGGGTSFQHFIALHHADSSGKRYLFLCTISHNYHFIKQAIVFL